MSEPPIRQASAWVLCTGEPLPLDPGTPRLLRAGLLCERLVQEGFQVDFWTSNFDHASKRHRADPGGQVDREVSPQYRIHLLPSSGYSAHVSLARVRDHFQIGRAFARGAEAAARPDVLVISMPTIDLAHAGAAYAVKHGVPFVVDLRDMWPEVFYLDRPFPVRQAIRLLTSGWGRKLDWAIRRADAVVGITDEFVEWGCRRAGRTRLPGCDVGLPLAYPAPAAPTAEETETQRALVASGALRPDAFQVAFLGSFSHRIDLATLCEVGEGAGAAGLPVHIVVAGSGEGDEALRKAYDGPKVRFLGRVGQSAVRAILRTSKVGVVPYRNAVDFRMGIPNKAVEYLAYGLPVVTSLRGALERLIESQRVGSIYEEDDPKSLLSCLERYLAHPEERDEQSRNARAVFARDFSTDVVFDRYVRLISALAGRRTDRSGGGSGDDPGPDIMLSHRGRSTHGPVATERGGARVDSP